MPSWTRNELIVAVLVCSPRGNGYVQVIHENLLDSTSISALCLALHRGIGTDGYLGTEDCRLSPPLIISAGLSSWRFEEHVLTTIRSRGRWVYSAYGISSHICRFNLFIKTIFPRCGWRMAPVGTIGTAARQHMMLVAERDPEVASFSYTVLF